MPARFARLIGAGPWLVAAALALALAACGGAGSKDRNKPVVLSYPYGESGPYLFADYDRVIAAAAASYVAITIRSDPGTAVESGHNLVSAASGTIIDPAGYIVTAAHIAVDEKYHAEVKTIDGRIHKGKILRIDRDRELAMIKIPPVPGLVAARLADSTGIVQGANAVAIGSPRLRTGIVSLGLIKEPRLSYPLKYSGYSYSDAVVVSMEVEPGHSGGPLFDDSGALIGIIASFALGDTRKVPYVSPRIAFAVPSRDIEVFVQEVIGDH
jgi:S1-C subfamily serine protease